MGFIVRMIERLADNSCCVPSFESLGSKVFSVILSFLLYGSFGVLLVELFVFFVLCGLLRSLMPFCEACCKLIG